MISSVMRRLKSIQSNVDRLDEGFDRRELEKHIRGRLEEARHYRLVADIVQELGGQKITGKEAHAYGIHAENPELPENNKKMEYERSLISSQNPFAELAIDLGEGGGLGWLMAVSEIKGGELENRIAEAFRIIIEDELHHGPLEIVEACQMIKTEEELQKTKEYLVRRCQHHLRMKNEQFGYPLTESRMKEIDAGKIAPLRINVDEITPISPYSA